MAQSTGPVSQLTANQALAGTSQKPTTSQYPDSTSPVYPLEEEGKVSDQATNILGQDSDQV